MNFVYEKAKPNGLTLAYANLSPMSELLAVKGVRYKNGKFTWLQALQGVPLMMFARTDAVPGGLKKPSDIVKATKLILPGLRPTVSLDLVSRPTLDLFGLKYTYLSLPFIPSCLPTTARLSGTDIILSQWIL